MKPQYWICRARSSDGTYHAFRWTFGKYRTPHDAVQECYGRGISEAYEALPIGTRKIASERRQRELAAATEGWFRFTRRERKEK
jgi:hypothetical protein